MRYFDYLRAVLFLLSLLSPTLEAKKFEKVLLSKVQSLTLRGGLKTTHRRVSAVPQLKCVGGNAKDLYDVDVMRCKNQGSDYTDEDIQWTCTANLPPEFKLGSTDVICEGYASSDDPYVLKGSCGVEYRIILTDKGEEKYGKRKGGWTDKGSGGGGSPVVGYIFWALFIGVVLWMLYSAFIRSNTTGPRLPRQPRAPRSWGGGGGGGDDNDPPPPYDWRPSKPSSYGATGGSGPGFWSGAAGGAAAGYAASRMFGGGGASRNNDRGEGSSRSGGSSSSSGSGYSNSRYDSSGFGGTSRR